MFLSTKRKTVSGGLRQVLRSVLLVLVLGFSSFVQALPILDITTPNTALTIPVGTTADVVYTVTNTSGIFLPDLSIHAPALMAVNPASTTCGTSLVAGGVCTVGVTIGPSQLPGLLPLKPLGVCAFGCQLCAVSAANQRIQANFTLVTPPIFGYHLYLTLDGGDIDIFDTATNTVIETIAGGGSTGIAMTPDETRAYVADFSADSVNVIDIASNMIITSIAVGDAPFGVAVTPDGSHVYVANVTLDTVSVIDTSTNMVIDTIAVGDAPVGVVVTPDGSRVYVANFNSSDVSVIATATNMVIDTIAVGDEPLGIAVTPDGSRVYVTNRLSDTVSVIDTDTVIDTIAVGNGPQGVAVTPDGSRVYVANFGSDTVSVIDTATDTVVDTIAVGDAPIGVHVTPDGSRAYVVNNFSDTVSVIDTATDTVIATAPLGTNPSGFGDFLSV